MNPESSQPLVSIIAGSSSDADVVAACRQVLNSLEIVHEARVLSAHRTPRELQDYVEQLEPRGVRSVIAVAGLAAHLAGVVAAHTRLPVFGVPVAAAPLAGLDALLSVVQMPTGVPVGCLGLSNTGAKNAAYLVARILALGDSRIRARLEAFTEQERLRILAAEALKPNT